MSSQSPTLLDTLLNSTKTSIKLVDILARTVKHMWRVPRGEASRELIAQHARLWALDLLDAADITVIAEGTPPPWGIVHMANHRSFMDVIVVMSQAPGTFLAKAEVADWPIIGPAAKLGGTVFVKREAKDSRKAARETLRELLDDGDSVTIFPEGTTTAPPGTIKFRSGAFKVAADAGCPIMPIAIEYPRMEDAWINGEPTGKYYRRVFNRPMTVRLRFGPIMEGDDGDELCARAHAWINAELDLLDKEIHG